MKTKYEPHRKLAEKVTDSTDRDYNRKQSQAVIYDELSEIGQQLVSEAEFQEPLRFGGDTGIDADFYLTEEMYERGFHIEMPEN